MAGVLRTHVIPAGSSHAGTTVHICRDAAAAAEVVCEIVASTTRAAAAERGYASLAVPGGSVLKMLSGLTDQVYPVYLPFSSLLHAYAR
jgi:6-phosphogluconolactonase/glucosamine-6-phosphate isomerase/deaminase